MAKKRKKKLKHEKEGKVQWEAGRRRGLRQDGRI